MRDRGNPQKTHVEAQARDAPIQASLFEPPETEPVQPTPAPLTMAENAPPSWSESLARYLAGWR